jgi:gluconokinase
MQQRPGHYMKPTMLASQFDALEEPHDALTLDIEQPPDPMVDHIIQTLIGPQETKRSTQ